MKTTVALARRLLLALSLTALVPSIVLAQGGGGGGGATRPTLPGGGGGGVVTLPGGGGIATLPGGGIATRPGINGGAGFLPGGGGGGINVGGTTGTARIVSDAGILVGDPSQAIAIAPNQTAAAPGTGGTATPVAATYTWTIAGGRIVGSSTAATVNYLADAAGTVTLTVAVTTAGATSTATSTVTAISAATAGTINAPATAATATGPTAPTLTVSVPAAVNADRTFRWTVTGDAAITTG